MKKKAMYYSIVAVTILVAASFVSVVGYQSIQENEKVVSSPLFTIRTQQAIQKESDLCLSMFLGKGKQVNIFPMKVSTYEDVFQTALRIFGSNPSLLYRLLDKIDRYPGVAGLLTKHGISSLQFKNYVNMIRQDPSVVTKAVNEIHLISPAEGTGEPLGLSTSNPIGCFIVALVALVPIAVIITLLALLFTLRILTCMNFNDCANNIAETIWEQLIQGLTQE